MEDDEKKPKLTLVDPESGGEAPDDGPTANPMEFEMMVRGFLAHVEAARGFVPAFPEEHALSLARVLAHEQMQIDTRVVPLMQAPDNPIQVLRMITCTGNDWTQGHSFECMRNLGQSPERPLTREDVVMHALVIGLLTSPTARAIIRMHGYNLAPSFVKPRSPIITL